MTGNQRFLIAVTIVNVAVSLVSLSHLSIANATRKDMSAVLPVLRARALEIVDGAGHVRASIKVHPADPKARMPEGSATSDSVVLRLINPDGRPGVKLASSEREAGLALIGPRDNYLQVFADGMKVTKDSKERAAWP